MNDETMLREALHDLTLDQPAAPVGRVVGVRRRHVRRRTTQLGVGAGIVALLAVAAALIRAPFGNDTQPAHRSVPSWALPWPDHRDGSVSQAVLDTAVSAWRRMQHADQSISVLPEPTSVTWYVGQRAVDDSQIIVMFEADSAEGHRLVAGFAGVNGIRGDYAPGSSPWILYDVPAPPSSYRGIIGLNVSQTGAVTADSYRNWVVVLTRPSVRQVGWSGSGIAGGASLSDRGLLIADVGRPIGQVFASISENPDRIGVVGQPMPVGVPGAPKSAAPLLRPPAPLHGVPVGQSMGESRGQGSSVYGNTSFRGSGSTTIYARCYGVGPIRVAIDDETLNAGVTIPCDGRQHIVAGDRLRKHFFDQGHGYEVTASDLTAWRVTVVAN